MTTRDRGIDERREALLACVSTLAARLPAIQRPGQDVVEKSSADDIVTAHDIAMQRDLIAQLRPLFPGAQILGEEGEGLAPDALEAALASDEGLLIIDPIDGTTNFVYGYKHSAVSVAYARRGKIELAVVCDPWLGDSFSAARGHGAYCGTRPLKPTTRGLDGALIAFGTSPYERETLDASYRLLRALHERGTDIRRSGCAALDLCYVADGRVDLFFELRLSPWDYAAGRLIATEAGAVISDGRGRELGFAGPSTVICGTKEAHEAALAELVRLDLVEMTRP